MIIVLLTQCGIYTYAYDTNDPREYLQSETPYFEHINTSLNSNVCRVMLEDQDGYIWIGTRNGISRYDGITIQNIFVGKSKNKYEYDTQSLCEDTVNNCIWTYFNNKNCLLKIDKETLTSEYIEVEFGKKESRDLISSMMSYNDTLLLLTSSSEGLLFCDKRTGATCGSFFNEKPSVREIVETPHNVLIINNQGIYKLIGRTTDKPTLEQFDIQTEGVIRNVDSPDDTTIVFTASSQMSRQYNLYKYNTLTHVTTKLITIKRETITRTLPNDITCCADGIWISSSSGVLFYRYKNCRLYDFNTRNSYLPENNVMCSLRCRNQPVVFFGSADGIIKTDYYASKFNIVDFRHASDSRSCNMFMIHKDKFGGYWSWCVDGLYYKAPGEYVFHHKSIDPVIDGQSMLAMAEDTARNTVYISCLYHVIEYNLLTHKYRFIYENTASSYPQKVFGDGHINMNQTSFNNLKVLPNGTMVCSLRNHLLFYSPQNNKYSAKVFADSMAVRSIDSEADSIIWFASNNSISSYNLKTQEINTHQIYISKKASINNIRVIYREGQKELWIATRLNGLYYYLPSKDKLSHIEYSSYLYNEIYSLEVDKLKNVWAASSDGIVCINNTTGTVYEYGSETNALCQTFNNRTSCVGWNGEVLMGGVNYFVEFKGEIFPENNYYPSPIVTSYKFLNSTTNSFDSYTNYEYFNAKDTIRIPKGIRSIQLTIRVLNYSNSQNNRIQWRMPDTDATWSDVSTTSPLIFSNLSKGLHKIELRSINSKNMPEEAVTTLFFDKSVYFYEDTLFHVFIIICVICIVVASVYIKSRIESKRRRRLEMEVERQAGDIRRSNQKLIKNQKVIERQNIELTQIRKNLEKQVAERTADLEIAKQKAEESSKLKSAFLANLSHEVRTPMNCIVGFAKLLGDPTCSKEEQTEFVHLIQESSTSLLVLIGDLLDVSRIESGQLRVNKRYFNIYNEINDAYRILFVEKKNPNVDFMLEIDPNLYNASIYSDKDRVRQILINICYNAFKFTDKGHVMISAHIVDSEGILKSAYPATFPEPDSDKRYLLVSIEDTGIGIAKENLNVIFEPFRKINNNRTLYPGLGLGLNIVKNLVMILDGQVWVTSEVGQGTTFYFYLPFTDEE